MATELDYRLIKELWAHQGARIAVHFAYEYYDASGRWFRAYGNELGVRRQRLDAAAYRQHQRSSHPRD